MEAFLPWLMGASVVSRLIVDRVKSGLCIIQNQIANEELAQTIQKIVDKGQPSPAEEVAYLNIDFFFVK